MTTNKVSKIQQRVNNAKAGVENVPLDSKVEKSNNIFWDEARNFYVQCMQAIHRVEGELCEVLKDVSSKPDLMRHVEDQSRLAGNVTILNKDLSDHITRLNQIYAKHSDKSGGTMTPDDHMQLLQINSEYVEAMEIYDANIVPSVAVILEAIGAAEALLNSQVPQEPALTELQDPSIISDVQIKEVV